jgi:hypothetical protein
LDVQALGPIPEESMEAYLWTIEIYSSTRMLLAALNADQLAAVSAVTLNPVPYVEDVPFFPPFLIPLSLWTYLSCLTMSCEMRFYFFGVSLSLYDGTSLLCFMVFLICVPGNSYLCFSPDPVDFGRLIRSMYCFDDQISEVP